MNGHLDDELIQEYAANPAVLTVTAAAHIAGCAHCQARAAGYRELFSQVSELPKPAFDFDLSKLVMEKIAVSNPNPVAATDKKTAWTLWSLAIVSVAVFGSILYYLRDYLTDLMSGLSSAVTILVILTMLLIAVFLVIDEYRKYNKQINSLDF